MVVERKEEAEEDRGGGGGGGRAAGYRIKNKKPHKDVGKRTIF